MDRKWTNLFVISPSGEEAVCGPLKSPNWYSWIFLLRNRGPSARPSVTSNNRAQDTPLVSWPQCYIDWSFRGGKARYSLLGQTVASNELYKSTFRRTTPSPSSPSTLWWGHSWSPKLWILCHVTRISARENFNDYNVVKNPARCLLSHFIAPAIRRAHIKVLSQVFCIPQLKLNSKRALNNIMLNRKNDLRYTQHRFMSDLILRNICWCQLSFKLAQSIIR
jgi:hypothetical protein